MPNTQIITQIQRFWVDLHNTRVFHLWYTVIDCVLCFFFYECWLYYVNTFPQQSQDLYVAAWLDYFLNLSLKLWVKKKKEKKNYCYQLMWFASGFLKLCAHFIYWLTHFPQTVTIFILQSRGKVHCNGDATKIVQRHYGKVQHCGCNVGKSWGNEYRILCAAVIIHYCIYLIKVVDSVNQIIHSTIRISFMT